MTDIDHRAEAEKWLHHAEQVQPGDAATEFALIGIGHALLAGQQAAEHPTLTDIQNYLFSGIRPTTLTKPTPDQP